MKWPWFFILLLISCVYIYSQERFFPDYSFLDPTLIACFLILRSQSSRKTLLMVFIFTITIDLICLGSQIKGITTLAILPLIYFGISIKAYILPLFSDLALFVFFFFGYLVNYFTIKWLFDVFGQSVPVIPLAFVGFQLLVHSAIFGGILIFLGRLKGKKP